MKILLYVAVAFLAAQGLVWAFDPGGKKIPGSESVQPRQPLSSDAGSAGQSGREVLPSAIDYSGRVLPEMKGVVSWRTLAQVQSVKQKDRFLPQFSDNITRLDKKEVRLQGFMMPLDMGEKQKRFLLVAVPPSCAFCLPAGPDALVEVRAKTPLKYGFEPIVVSGKFVVLNDDPMGLYYRLTDAVPVTQ